MERVQFEEHNGKEVLVIDFSRCTANDAFTVIEHATKTIRNRPEQSLLTLADVTDLRFNEQLSERMKEFTAHNKPYVRAAAVVGVTGLKKIMFEAIMAFSRRKLHAFEDREAAKAWLVTN